MINDFFLTEWFFDLLRWLYSVLGNNYFLTIFIVTLALRIAKISANRQRFSPKSKN